MVGEAGGDCGRERGGAREWAGVGEIERAGAGWFAGWMHCDRKSSFRAVLAPYTARRSLQNPAAEREIRVVLISVICKTTIQLQSYNTSL